MPLLPLCKSVMVAMTTWAASVCVSTLGPWAAGVGRLDMMRQAAGIEEAKQVRGKNKKKRMLPRTAILTSACIGTD